MQLNPYQSPREAGYDAPKPAPLPMWIKVVRVVFAIVALSYVFCIAVAVAAMTFDYLGWRIGF